MNFDEIDRDKLLECVHELQRHMMIDMSPTESWRELEKKYSGKLINMALDMLKFAKTNENSPYKKISEIIDKCMHKLSKEDSDTVIDVETFYMMCEKAYKIFMNDKEGRGMPLVFLWNKGTNGMGICPVPQDNDSKSPMSYIEQIVNTSRPDAYCFCGEASGLKSKDDPSFDPKHSKYGDIINNPKSKDCVVLMGNNKENTKQLKKIFMITGKTGKLKFKLRHDKDMKFNKMY